MSLEAILHFQESTKAKKVRTMVVEMMYDIIGNRNFCMQIPRFVLGWGTNYDRTSKQSCKVIVIGSV